MGVMSARRVRHTEPTPYVSRRGDERIWPGADPVDELEEVFWSLGEIPGHRTELLEGQIIVSPSAVFWHNHVVTSGAGSVWRDA